MPNAIQHRIAATQAIKAKTSMRALFLAIHDGREPTRIELQQLANRLNPNRSNPGADLLGQIVASVPELQQMTLGEFFGITQDHSR